MGVLSGKVAIVTGSARGIGRATAELLAVHGARVLISDLDEELAAQTAAEIEGETVTSPHHHLATGMGDSRVHVREARIRPG